MDNYLREKLIASFNSKSFSNLLKKGEKSSSAPNKRDTVKNPEPLTLVSPKFNPGIFKNPSGSSTSKFSGIQYKRNPELSDSKFFYKPESDIAAESKTRFKHPVAKEDSVLKEQFFRLQAEFEEFKESVVPKSKYFEKPPSYAREKESTKQRAKGVDFGKSDIEALKRHSEEFENQLEQERVKIRNLEKLLKEKEETVDDFRITLQSLKEAHQKVKNEVDGFTGNKDLELMTEKVADIEKKIEKLEETNEKMSQETTKLSFRTKTKARNNSNPIDSSWGNPGKDLEAKVVRLKNIISDLTKENTSLRMLIIENSDLKDEINRKIREINELKQQVEEPEEIKKMNPVDSFVVSVFAKKKPNLEPELARKSRQLISLEEELKDSQKFIDLFHAEVDKSLKLAEEVKHLNEVIKVLQLNESQSLPDSLSSLKQTNLESLNQIHKLADQLYEKNLE